MKTLQNWKNDGKADTGWPVNGITPDTGVEITFADEGLSAKLFVPSPSPTLHFGVTPAIRREGERERERAA